MKKFAECPNCQQLHEVKEAYTQATRQEPSQFIGEYMICPATQIGTFAADIFKPIDGLRFENVQLGA